jgi:hypothetical protein
MQRKIQRESLYDPNISVSRNSRVSKKKSEDMSYSLPRQSILASKIY